MIAGLPFLLEIGHPASNTDTLGCIVLVAPTSDSDARGESLLVLGWCLFGHAACDEIIVFCSKKKLQGRCARCRRK